MEAGATGGGGCCRVRGWAWTYVYCVGKVSLGMFRVQMSMWMLERRGYVRRVDLAGEHLATIIMYIPSIVRTCR